MAGSGNKNSHWSPRSHFDAKYIYANIENKLFKCTPIPSLGWIDFDPATGGGFCPANGTQSRRICQSVYLGPSLTKGRDCN